MEQEITWLLNEKYQGQLTEAAQKDIARLKAGEPVDYVIGHKDFLGCRIDLRYRPLIPREETAFWVGQAIENLHNSWATDPSRLQCLDIFSGSGCCGLAVLKQIADSVCDFADIDDNCLKQIRFNLKLNDIDSRRYRVVRSDVFEHIKRRYDVILANPPYIASPRISQVQKSALKYEPRKALIAKESGLFLIKKFLQEAKQHLNDNGIIYMEFDPAQKKEIEQLLKKYSYSNYQFHRDQYNNLRFVIIFACAKK